MGKAPSERGQAAAAKSGSSGSAPGASGAPPSNTAPYNCNWTDDYVFLRRGVDTLQLSYRGEMTDEWFTRLTECKPPLISSTLD